MNKLNEFRNGVLREVFGYIIIGGSGLCLFCSIIFTICCIGIKEEIAMFTMTLILFLCGLNMAICGRKYRKNPSYNKYEKKMTN